MKITKRNLNYRAFAYQNLSALQLLPYHLKLKDAKIMLGSMLINLLRSC